MTIKRHILTKDSSDDNLSQKRARIILPILVRQAESHQTITYGNLAKEIGIHHRVLRYPLDCIGNTIVELNRGLEEEIPQIQSVVVNQDTGMPGNSVNFLRNANSSKKEEIVKEMLLSVFNYPKWIEVLNKLGF